MCVCGDFNAVRCPEERRGTSGVFNTTWSDTFNNFIEDLTLLDLPLRGRMFTWFRGDGKSMSRIDRFYYLKIGAYNGLIVLRWPCLVGCRIIVFGACF